MSSILRGSFSWSGLNDIINTENHLGGLRGREEDASLELERLVDSKLRHITNSTVIDINAGVSVALVVLGSDLSDELGAVETSIISNNGRQSTKSTSKSLDGKRFLSTDLGSELIDGLGHQHLSTASTKCSLGILQGLQSGGKFIVNILAEE